MADAAKKADKPANPYHFWAARFWHGMRLGPWLRLLRKNRFRAHPFRWGLVATISFAAVLNSLVKPLQEWFLGKSLVRVPIKDDPIFIIGHWRSGTTFLHELMVLDDRFTCPTTYECFAPNHFFFSKWLVTKLKFLMPSQRPMDNMITGWDRPQEDEFALCNMGIPSPYLKMIFPNEPDHYAHYLNLEDLSAAELSRWKNALLWFLQRVTYRTPKQIVLKSPPHTGRIKTLLEMFPDARFVHIVRDPYVIHASTMKLWKTLYQVQAVQVATFEGLEEYVFDCFERMYASFEEHRDLIKPSRFFEVRYEDLVREPEAQLQALYEQLGLEHFDRVLPKLRSYLAGVQDYKTNKYKLDPAQCEKINNRWGRFMQRYGYCQEPVAAAEEM